MAESLQIILLPMAVTLTVEHGTALQDVLFGQGVEFPCGGRGRCKGCRIHVLSGSLRVTEEDQRFLSEKEIAEGWRLACQAKALGPLTIELAQWEASVLSDDSHFDFSPRPGLGIAVDLGTTTLVAQLLDLQTANVLSVRTALNAQARHGADIMSRIDLAMAGGQETLQTLIRQQIGTLIDELFLGRRADPNEVKEVVVVGNTVMHHLFCGISLEPLSHFPFEPVRDGMMIFKAEELGWKLNAQVRFLPCLGGFVGSDILAGVLATQLPESPNLVGLIDLGTNGEMVIGNRERMLCASTAAGPAFEGARISMGMRAATGAISEVSVCAGQLRCRVLGNSAARGICGSGLVDAVAAGLEIGSIQPSGRFAGISSLPLVPPVCLTQRDVRELQLAKGAIAAGLRILLLQWGATADDLTRVYLAGAFGNYISRTSARRIGLLHFPPEIIQPAGNTALRGAKLALFRSEDALDGYSQLRRKICHVPLSEDAQFQDIFIEELMFPA